MRRHAPRGAVPRDVFVDASIRPEAARGSGIEGTGGEDDGRGGPQECDHLYEGQGRPRDFVEALACFRAREDWVTVTIMQLNGEGVPVDIAGARASFKRQLASKGSRDADDDALEDIIKKREANPAAKARRVDFCRDVARTTVSVNPCERQ